MVRIDNLDDGPDKRFRDYLARGEFRIQRCRGCDRHIFYPRLMCIHCGATGLEWVQACGRGVVYSTSVPRSEHGAYNVALIDLEEGPRMMSRVVDVDPEAVAIGMPVQAFIAALDAGSPELLVLFRPQPSEPAP